MMSNTLKYIAIISICLLPLGLNAQKARVKNQPYVDMKWYHLGFHVGLHTQDLILTNTGATALGQTLYAEIPSYSPGISVGVIGDLYLNPYLNLRLTPTIHFGDKKLSFTDIENEMTYERSIRSTYLQIPMDLKYTAMRLNNYRPYLLGGAYVAYDLGRKKGEAILLKTMDYGLEFGIGCDIYLPYFKLCPEIKFCFGLPNILETNRPDLLNEEDKIYSNALSGAKTRMIVLTFNFE